MSDNNFVLSEKIDCRPCGKAMTFLLVKDVKEFIRRFKKELLDRFSIDEGDLGFIDELAGEELSK